MLQQDLIPKAQRRVKIMQQLKDLKQLPNQSVAEFLAHLQSLSQLANTQPVMPGQPNKHPAEPNSWLASNLENHTSQIIPLRRCASPDELIEARAQLDTLRRIRREDEFAKLEDKLKNYKVKILRKKTAMNPRLIPLKTCFPAVKVKFFRQIFDHEFDPIDITRL